MGWVVERGRGGLGGLGHDLALVSRLVGNRQSTQSYENLERMCFDGLRRQSHSIVLEFKLTLSGFVVVRFQLQQMLCP